MFNINMNFYDPSDEIKIKILLFLVTEKCGLLPLDNLFDSKYQKVGQENYFNTPKFLLTA